MDVSVIIPTHGRPRKVAACISALARQTLDHDRYEVLVGVDGGSDEAERLVREAWAQAGGRVGGVKIIQCEKSGQAAVRNRLFPLAAGRTYVFLNDDMIPAAECLAAHLAAQREQEARGKPALVVGDSPWRPHEPDRLFDRLVRETSMVFFYDKMRGCTDRDRDWGFRHAWMLNLSAPAAAVREVGGLTVFPSTYGYEDDDLAFRLGKRFGMPVLYRPEAVAVHDHQMEPREYLERERKLGFAAWGFAGAAPECAAAMFGRDIRSKEEVDYSRQFLARERATVERMQASFEGLAGTTSMAVGGMEPGKVLNLIYEQHLMVKRWWWRKGLLEAADATA